LRSRGEGILPLFFCVEGILPSNRGQDARDTQGRDALATGQRDRKPACPDRKNGHAPTSDQLQNEDSSLATEATEITERMKHNHSLQIPRQASNSLVPFLCVPLYPLWLPFLPSYRAIEKKDRPEGGPT